MSVWARGQRRGGVDLIDNRGGAEAPHQVRSSLINQKTIASPAGCTGIALHSGARANVCIAPADTDTGIVVRRIDIVNGGSIIPVSWRNVVDSRLATTIGNGYGITVSTIEHLMAALAGCEIDNAIIEVDGPELPIMDGSAAAFVQLIEQAGVVAQAAPRRAIKIRRRIDVGDHERSISLTPANTFSISFEIDFDAEPIARQELTLRTVNGNFKSDLAPARTFGFAEDVDRLRQAGLALGGSLENAIVISDGEVLNEEGLRYHDEFVRHKILDCIGDLYLAGAPIVGHVHGARSGHALNHRLVEKLFEQGDAWSYVDLADAMPVGHAGLEDGPAAVV